MTDGPIRASDVETVDERTDREKATQARKAAVQKRLAKRAGLVNSGGDVTSGSDGIADRLARNLAKRDANQTKAFRAQQAVAAKIEAS